MSDIDAYRALLLAVVPHQRDLRHGARLPAGNLRLPRDPKRALADMQATLNDINEKKKERGWG